MEVRDPSLAHLAEHFGSDKGHALGDWGIGHAYTDVYERLLRSRRHEPLRLLELGVWRGASLRMWEAYFPKAEIVGIENLPDIVEEEFDRAQVIIGDATDAKLLKEVANKFKGAKIDIIIDDASHVLEQQIASFEALFPHLEEGGLYFVEDVCCSRFKDGNRGTVPFVDFLDYAWSITQQTTFFPNDDLESYHTIKDIRYLDDDKRPRLTFSPWNEQLEAVYFFHDLCVFEKKTRAGLAEGIERTQTVRPLAGLAYKVNQLRAQENGPEQFSMELLAQDDHSELVERCRNAQDEIKGFIAAVAAQNGTKATNLTDQAGIIMRLIQPFDQLLFECLRLSTALSRRDAALASLRLRTNEVESDRMLLASRYGGIATKHDELAKQLKRAATQRDADFADAKAQIEALERAAAQRDAELADARAQIEALERAAAQRDAELADAKARENSVAKQLAFAERERTQALTAVVLSAQKRLAAREHEITIKQETIARANRHIAQLEAAAAARDKQLSDRAAALDNALKARENTNAKLWQALAERDDQITALDKTIAALRTSSSWRHITVPSRVASSNDVGANNNMASPAARSTSDPRNCAIEPVRSAMVFEHIS